MTRKIRITEKRLLKAGFTLCDNDLYELKLVKVTFPKCHWIELWARTERGLGIFLETTQETTKDEDPEVVCLELHHIKHMCELNNLVFALTGSYLEIKDPITSSIDSKIKHLTECLLDIPQELKDLKKRYDYEPHEIF